MTDRPRAAAITAPTPAHYRRVIGQFATGVAVVTVRDGDAVQGMTVNSLTSVSLDPPTLLVCLTRGTRTALAVESAGEFVVNLLSDEQKQLSNAYARPGEDRGMVRAAVAADGPPVLDRALANLVCDVRELHDGEDHAIVVARVRACRAGSGEPLIFYAGRYVRQIAYDDYPVASWWS